MKKKWITAGILGLALMASGANAASERATKAEAEAMVKKAVEYIKANGPEKAYPEINNTKGQFNDRDLYVVVYDMTGKCLAHGQKTTMVGKDLINMMDVDGKAYIKERVDLGKTKASFWQEYKFKNPVNEKIEPKEMYCEKLSETLVCAGVYKENK